MQEKNSGNKSLGRCEKRIVDDYHINEHSGLIWLRLHILGRSC